MKSFIPLTLIILLSCSGLKKENSKNERLKIKTAEVVLPPSFVKAQELLLKMTSAEKKQILKSYITLRALSTGHLNPTVSSNAFFVGIPRLGIPSIEFIPETPSESLATNQAAPLRQEGEILKLGSVNLIRNFEKEQVFENFSQASQVDTLLSPNKKPESTSVEQGQKLQDLDIFMVRSGSEESVVKDYICAIHRKTDSSYTCVESRFEQNVSELGLHETLAEALARGELSSSQIDNLVIKMLATMYELNIIN